MVEAVEQRLQDLANAFEPRLSVELRDEQGAPRPAQIAYRVLDPRTAQPGPAVLLGPAPLREAVVPQGHLRIVALLPGGDVRGLTRHFDLASHLALDVVVRATSSEGMVFLPAGACEGLPHEGSPLNGQRLQIEPFWLDACEVSVGDYRAFLDAHPDARVPSWLREAPRGGPLDRRPMTDVTFDEAQRYAEWRGKRLMTHAEWLRACRGDAERLFPCDGDPRHGNTTAQHDPAKSEAERFELYRRHTVDVDAPDDARSPEGIYHLYGNVWEWTESHISELEAGRFIPQPDLRITVGGGWNVHTLGFDLRHIRRGRRGSMEHDLTRGFRCARSASH